MKRLLDFVLALAGLVVLAIPLIMVLVLVWQQDWRSPFYLGERVGIGGRPFRMVKVRSMVINADRNGVESTGANDNRITAIGHFVRRWKIDEISQLWNVLVGDMSLVGPRPNTVRGVEVYTDAERRLLKVKPGITDISSIVFSDEGEILKDSADPDADYDRLIRPWKSRLTLFCIDHSTPAFDCQLILLTAIAVFNKPRALRGVVSILRQAGAEPELVTVAEREIPLDRLVGVA